MVSVKENKAMKLFLLKTRFTSVNWTHLAQNMVHYQTSA